MKKFLLVLLIVFIAGFIILPNIFNSREKAAFSKDLRLAKAIKEFEEAPEADSITMGLSTFYKRGKFIRYLFGSEYRSLWQVPVTFPVWQDGNNDFEMGDVGGGEQTTSVDMTGPDGLTYTLRSVIKDQARAVTSFLQPTLARTIARDQASSLNPYAAPVVTALAGEAGIPHMNPVLYYIPFLPSQNREENLVIAGQVMLMEEEPDESWNYSERFGVNSKILSTQSMMELRSQGKVSIDSVLFARCRIFDIIIGDWDRHEKQWKWACDTITEICSPLPVDRDMAFYDFRGGIIDKLALWVVPKFQSFDTDMPNLEGYLKNGITLQRILLENVSPQQWQEQAAILQSNLQTNRIDSALRKYPPVVYNQYGKRHQAILEHRVAKSDSIALFLYESIK